MAARGCAVARRPSARVNRLNDGGNDDAAAAAAHMHFAYHQNTIFFAYASVAIRGVDARPSHGNMRAWVVIQ